MDLLLIGLILLWPMLQEHRRKLVSVIQVRFLLELLLESLFFTVLEIMHLVDTSVDVLIVED